MEVFRKLTSFLPPAWKPWVLLALARMAAESR